ncbi:hypothetical protein KM1_323880 [Entamoeba histolytica HM-3:IMSS]|uniref:Uncharacterized protein n=5 Tax=Entamoeba TaxID=5758 RepID=C4MAM9_ENTH1|nr:hypothetical protein EHI_196780 [Entamoeba histolytica HM-1:IMSS]EAL43411.1 hypothetical protein EHI_196780 [Entamoeba histolytica HM-1:IMSS]EMD43406.1 Hypothetical protein EHI5A_190970 [Entamoeba histolytica KU27]EMS13281.1 hypothetical protein KM1_323880 [Entamoeba histolytica HM-3:IMSS]GAT98880.1 hypothetical protein CL6EHI_196780 [Entamoeba histolytica]|eukprot:XP_648798.1 hypothetical protein EHI_196780 [Entamoeba histolytica HM-1:IMSS]
MSNTQQNIFETQPNENNELPPVLIRATNPTIEEAAPKKTRNQKDKMNQYIKRQLNDNLNDLMEDIISENKRLRKEIEKIRNMYNQEMKTNEEIRNGLLEQRLEVFQTNY